MNRTPIIGAKPANTSLGDFFEDVAGYVKQGTDAVKNYTGVDVEKRATDYAQSQYAEARKAAGGYLPTAGNSGANNAVPSGERQSVSAPPQDGTQTVNTPVSVNTPVKRNATPIAPISVQKEHSDLDGFRYAYVKRLIQPVSIGAGIIVGAVLLYKTKMRWTALLAAMATTFVVGSVVDMKSIRAKFTGTSS